MEDRHSIVILFLIFLFAVLTVKTIVRLETHRPALAAEYPSASR
ncbi:hypothetical protein [Rhizobium sp. C4]|nr:hypothetical protein [Rhizobium sp. C4]